LTDNLKNKNDCIEYAGRGVLGSGQKCPKVLNFAEWRYKLCKVPVYRYVINCCRWRQTL